MAMHGCRHERVEFFDNSLARCNACGFVFGENSSRFVDQDEAGLDGSAEDYAANNSLDMSTTANEGEEEEGEEEGQEAAHGQGVEVVLALDTDDEDARPAKRAHIIRQLNPLPPPAIDEKADPQTDLFETMMAKERHAFAFTESPWYLCYRRIIVDWICQVGQDFQLKKQTIHMAVTYLERCLLCQKVSKKKLQLVSLCCLLVAAKYEEQEDYVPQMDDLCEATHNVYTHDNIRDMEVVLLNTLNWDMGTITSVHFLALFEHMGVCFEDDIVDGKPFSERAQKYVVRYVQFFAEICLQEYAFRQYLPSLLAASIVACARRAVKIRPIWSPQLIAGTSYNEKQIFPCYSHIYDHYVANFPTATSASHSPKCVSDEVDQASTLTQLHP